LTSHFYLSLPFFVLEQFIMKFVAALAFLTAVSANPFAPMTKSNSQAAVVSKLVRGAVPTANSQLGRELDEQYQPDISSYYLKFEKCQFVKAYDDELAENDEAGTVLATKRFVIFRLCPDSGCSSCNYNYGEYLVDLETYLESTVEYAQETQEEMCNACEENCYNNNQNNNERFLQNNYYSVDCDSCVDECEKIENMEDNGYIDATEFLECQMIYDPEDDNTAAIYAGPVCSSSGTKIKIGVFTDEDCLFADTSKDVEDYLMNDDGGNMMLSHALLKTTYTDTCISCLQVDENEEQNQYNNNGEQQEAEVLELCEQIYEEAAKCEKTHGFDNGFANYYGYENQLSNEEVVCDFMQSLKSGTYDEEGEIIVSGSSGRFSGSATTGGQKFALTFFVLGTVGLALYAGMLHTKLTKGSDLTSSGGAMA